VAAGTGFALYWIRMFAITGGFHRYFSHRSFKTSRIFQFLLALLGTMAGQKGPLWWAAHHRVHHQKSDSSEDVHSPIKSGFFWSHMGWIMSRENFSTKSEEVRDLGAYPELRWLDRHFVIPPLVLAAGLFASGWILQRYFPQVGVNGLQMLAWGFFVSTTVLYHGTFSINSFGHLWGSRRYQTNDASRNNLALALITMGEGWHNNHHRFPQSERQGFFWWEIDMTHGVLKLLSFLGVVWDLQTPPKWLLDRPRSQ
jgi:stearoyl-CoA desaturase (Delta-9 desaturase)